MPVNSDLTFYDGKRQYQSGRMPFITIKKEISNVLGGQLVYREADNSSKEFGRPMLANSLGQIVNAIAVQSDPSKGASFLNTYMLKYDKVKTKQQTPGAIQPEEQPDFSGDLKRQRQIQMKVAAKHRHDYPGKKG
jgi:hypothetical protein